MILMVTTSLTPVVAAKLPVGTRVAVYGDSIMQYSAGTSWGLVNASITHNQVGELVQVHMAYPSFDMDCWLSADTYDQPYGKGFYGSNHGYAGQTSATVKSRIQALVDMAPDVVVYAAGTNDGIESPSNLADSVQNCKDICTTLLAAGVKKIVVIGVRPTGAVQMNTNRRLGRISWASQIAAYCALYPSQLYFCDTQPFYDTNNDWIFETGYSDDDLHPNSLGATVASAALLPIIQSLIAPGNIVDANPNPELLPNGGLFTGTGGTMASANFTGNLPAGWTLEYATGTTATAVATVEDNTDTGGKTLVLTVTPGASDSTLNLRPTTYPTSAVGQWFQTGFEASGTVSAGVTRTIDGSNTNYYTNGPNIAAGDNRLKRGWSIAHPYEARGTTLRPGLRIPATVAGGPFTIRIYRASHKRKTNPKTTWNAYAVPVNTVAPVATGTATVGSTLTSTTGTWDRGLSYRYRWYRDGVFIGNTTGVASTYVLVAGDSGKTITCGVSAANSGGRAVTEVLTNGILIA
jgi:lysophospholipase L1-like esterase